MINEQEQVKCKPVKTNELQKEFKAIGGER